MTVEAFFQDLHQDVSLRADAAEAFTEDAFTEVVTDHLLDLGSIDEFSSCKFIHRGMRVDGYSFNWDEGLLELFVSDYRVGEEIQDMPRAEMERHFKKAEAFFQKCCLARFVEGIESSHPAFALAQTILEEAEQIRRVRYYLLTNSRLTASVKELPPQLQDQREWSYRVWDLNRLAQTIGKGEPEEILVDFREMFGRDLVCLPADDGKGDVSCFLAVIPGVWLTAIYDKYGSRLLEQNVRTFLQVRGKVNKGLRRTILEEPRRFFPYNNGISATAEDLTESRHDGVTFVRAVKNLQIVNGGQTTASIFNAAKKDRGASIDQITVQMKLSVVLPALATELVPKISRFANSQNRVSDSDFFSNHPFHVAMEKISRHLPAPPREGSQTLTRWFYERAKGQYANGTAYASARVKAEFTRKYPRSQVISKTDLAKYVQTFRELPHEVSLGAQKNFGQFAEYIVDLWDKAPDKLNDFWFRRAVCEAIVFRRAEALVLHAPWYAQGYRANTVTYGLALLMHTVRRLGKELDYARIWKEQALPDAFQFEVLRCCEVAQHEIIGGAGRNNVINVTEWCKKKACWDSVKAVQYTLSISFAKLLLEVEEIRAEARDAQREQREISEAEIFIAVVQAGADYWKNVRAWACNGQNAKPSDLRLLDVAAEIPRRMPTEKQSLRLFELKSQYDGSPD